MRSKKSVKQTTVSTDNSYEKLPNHLKNKIHEMEKKDVKLQKKFEKLYNHYDSIVLSKSRPDNLFMEPTM